jgi:hypothetical protein
MKWLNCLLLLLFSIGCNQHQASFTPAETGLDAGREFMDGCLKGDFMKASYYMLTDQPNEGFLKATEDKYREADKEGRQQLRAASINIKEVIEPTDTTVQIHYSNTMDTTSKWLYIVKKQEGWKVDYKKSFQ